MIPLVIQIDDIIFQDFYDYKIAKHLMNNLPDTFTCHQVCEFLINHLTEWKWIKGKFNGFDHSWLSKDDLILDAYPWCCGSGPILIYIGGTLNPWKNLYNDLKETNEN